MLDYVKENNGISSLFITHDIEEAIYISDRILILNGEPAKIRKEIKEDLEGFIGEKILAKGEAESHEYDMTKDIFENQVIRYLKDKFQLGNIITDGEKITFNITSGEISKVSFKIEVEEEIFEEDDYLPYEEREELREDYMCYLITGIEVI